MFHGLVRLNFACSRINDDKNKRNNDDKEQRYFHSETSLIHLAHLQQKAFSDRSIQFSAVTKTGSKVKALEKDKKEIQKAAVSRAADEEISLYFSI